MKAYEMTFDEEGQSPDKELNKMTHAAGFYSTRQMFYELSKWNWEVDEIKRHLKKTCLRLHRLEVYNKQLQVTERVE